MFMKNVLMLPNISQIYSAKDLIWSWTSRTIKSRYQQSVLGWFWAVIQPAASVAVFAIVFTLFVPVNTGGTPYVLFSFTAMVPWTFFAASVTDMASSIVQNMSLVTKIYFPREAIPIAVMLARLLDFGVASILIIFLIIFYKISPFPLGWMLIPLILVIQIALTLGLGLACSAVNVFYRDVDPLLKVVVQIWFYASPIIYPVSMVPPGLQTIYYLNPMAGIIEAYRDVILNQTLPGIYLIEAAIISFLALLGGYWFFKRVEFLFSDIL
jgi:lipopolysaccharide transport system permease protein